MKITVTYASAGAGHRRAAEALYSYLRDNLPEADLELLDALETATPAFRQMYRRGYDFLVRHAVWLWGFCFRMTSGALMSRFFSFLNSLADHYLAGGVEQHFIRRQPDVIISTHFFPSEAASRLKIKGRIKSKLITVITDFAVHPFWLYPATDTYVVPSSYACRELLQRGVPFERIKEFGIPIDKKFFSSFDRERIVGALGIEKGKFTVLVVTGSFGIGPIEEIVEALRRDVQLLVVCAANEGLRQRLTKKPDAQVKVFGFVDNMEELMSVSDLIISKPGGMTIAEILAMGVAPLFISPIQGQETSNADVLQRLGIGMT
ncbi:MAG: glycosyltransferase, partial [Candidatus Omnitrophica bacterium]|nr:glycosyltransferase [Candidatus Omnitrophota bacterium]